MVAPDLGYTRVSNRNVDDAVGGPQHHAKPLTSRATARADDVSYLTGRDELYEMRVRACLADSFSDVLDDWCR